MAVILSLAVCAVLAGARSFVAIAEWAADADQATLDGLGVAARACRLHLRTRAGPWELAVALTDGLLYGRPRDPPWL